jgi:phage baseplate assembly protein W
MKILNLKSEYWAYDLSKNIISKGEIFDKDVINQSIELILSTFFGERFFNLSYGSSLPIQIHKTMNNAKGEKLVEEILQAIEIFENRIEIDKENVIFTFSGSTGILEINIPYFIIKQQVTSFFSKKISI